MNAQRILWLIASIVVLSFTACGPSEAEIAKIKQDSFEHGRRAGLREGERIGIRKGKEIGREQGREEGKEAAEKAYYNNGVEEGRAQEHPIAYEAGRKQGLKERLFLDVENLFRLNYALLIFLAISILGLVTVIYIFKRYFLKRVSDLLIALRFKIQYRFSNMYSSKQKAELEKEKWNHTKSHVIKQSDTAEREISIYYKRILTINEHIKKGLPKTLKEVAEEDIATSQKQIGKLKAIISRCNAFLENIEELKNGIDMMNHRASFSSSVDYDSVSYGFETLQEDIASFLRFDIKDLGENDDLDFEHEFSSN